MFAESAEPLSRNCDANMTRNEHVYALFWRPEAAGDNISGENVKTIEGYAALNLEVASISSFLDIPQNSVRDGGGGGGGHQR